MNQTMLRAAYVSSSIDTMSPARMIVALYDRLTVDLERAEQAMYAADPAAAHACLIHAQSIVSELHDTLDAELWPAARKLKDIYVFLLFELVGANVDKDPVRVATSRALVVPLRDAWTEAAGIVPSARSGA
ncbi:MAG: flagellar secretion chaperone FliS [Actinomycetota bacterium]|nr:flagellar secretion chaperone FliS [Actinomycetota bacterium]